MQNLEKIHRELKQKIKQKKRLLALQINQNNLEELEEEIKDHLEYLDEIENKIRNVLLKIEQQLKRLDEMEQKIAELEQLQQNIKQLEKLEQKTHH